MGMVYGSIRHTTSGRRKSTKSVRRTKRVFSTVSTNTTQSYRRPTPKYPSDSGTAGVAARVEPPRYTGTLVKGIGTMHKSNAIPIIDEQQMKDLASMRR
jgi:hypothetical protein